MTFAGFLLQLGYNFLISIPGLLMLYFVIRRSIKDGISDAAKIATKQPVSIDSRRSAVNE